MQKNKSDSNVLWKLLAPHKPQKTTFIKMLLLVVAATSLELYLPMYSSHLVDSITIDGIDGEIIVTLLCIVFAAAIAEGVLGWYGGRIGQDISFKLRFSLVGRLLNMQQSEMEKQHSAELSARVVNDSHQVKSILAEDLVGLISGIISLLAVIFVMFFMDWRLTLVLIGCVVVGFIIITPLAMMMNGIGQAMQTSEADIMTHLTEWLRNSKLIKSHNASAQMHQRSADLLKRSYHNAMKETTVMAMIGPVANLILMLSMISILATSSYWIQQGTMTLGTVTAFLMYLFGLTFPLMAMGVFFSHLQKAAGAAKRLHEISLLPVENDNGINGLNNVETISLNDLSYSSDDKTILDNISLTFNVPGFTMITGHSGSGKSSLIQQLLGFHQTTRANISINGVPMDNIPLAEVRQNIAWVDQEPRLIHATVRENLTLGLTKTLSDTDLINALSQAGLTDWLARISSNLDLQISEQNHQFSGGEKQRFAIARALIRNAQILLLDEPTSALDHQNESAMMKLIRELSTKIRIIMVTHNKELILENDHVIHLRSGKLVTE